jgi:hypothetical protein
VNESVVFLLCLLIFVKQSGKASLGDALYKGLSSENFSAAQLLSTLDLLSEHSRLEIADRLETALLIWRRKSHTKHSTPASKSSWDMMKDFVADESKREQIADRAESLLLCLKQQFPGLTQTALDMNKIQHNRVSAETGGERNYTSCTSLSERSCLLTWRAKK